MKTTRTIKIAILVACIALVGWLAIELRSTPRARAGVSTINNLVTARFSGPVSTNVQGVYTQSTLPLPYTYTTLPRTQTTKP